ncbi:hypothetical protein ACFFGT_10285 [Mucilaginibacter angelicae]|uniref:Uncharacterized protein n=1 Tax=Mucilaginibacter angelicae TaxID=869718 RepID=A0ABV6L542_9SPHI
MFLNKEKNGRSKYNNRGQRISGLAGALLSQGLTGMFTYIADKRKFRSDIKNQYRNKQVETAESYYLVTDGIWISLKRACASGRTAMTAGAAPVSVLWPGK